MSKTTDELIQSLSANLAPVPRAATARRMAFGLGFGALASAVLMLTWLGVRPDILQAIAVPMFWMKFAYAALTAALLSLVLTRLSRPGARVGLLATLCTVPLIAMGAMAVMRLAQAEPAQRIPLMMGHSSQVCPWRIVIIGLPVMVGAVWAVRGLAPTRLLLAGLAAGGCAGAVGATVYSFACNEMAAPFVVIWYTLGMAALAAIGALMGSRWLRWT